MRSIRPILIACVVIPIGLRRWTFLLTLAPFRSDLFNYVALPSAPTGLGNFKDKSDIKTFPSQQLRGIIGVALSEKCRAPSRPGSSLKKSPKTEDHNRTDQPPFEFGISSLTQANFVRSNVGCCFTKSQNLRGRLLSKS